jgi:hypothetical protein
MFFKIGLKGHSPGTEEKITSVVYQDLGFLLQFENRVFFDKKYYNNYGTEGKIHKKIFLF